MAKKLVEVKNLKKHFKTKKGLLHAVDDISFDLYEGETLGLVGESGCGKSTTGRLLIRLLESTAGKVVYQGENVLDFNNKEMAEYRRDAQIVFQDPYSCLNPRWTIADIIAEPLRVNKAFSDPKKLQARILELMQVVGVEERLYYAYPHELDGGRRQRVGIARALALNPKFIIMDEPVSALDVCIQAQILNLLRKLQKEFGLTFLFIAHNLSVVKHVSDRIAVMYLGKIVELSDYKSIFKDPKHPYTQALLSAIPIAKLGEQRERIILDGDVSSPINPPDCCRFEPRCRHRQQICKDKSPELRELADGHFAACHFAGEL